ncbi:MAG: citrate lyase subunit beta / citryl-CoA lyase [Acidimicrobiaceae bacterium]|jgi:citrate lyase beta subunit|nr:citrate lyase subunit beta / citryl-CoA lyase [Acidimicrobiaceae bacterium]
MYEHANRRDPKYLGIRSILEAPVLDDHKWAKIPNIPADAILLDLEDSVPPARKEEGRQRVVHWLKHPEYFDGRITIARPNHLSTPWGREDLQALAEAGVTTMAYPKLETDEELQEVQEMLRAGGADPDIFAIVETSRAVFEIDKIAANDRVKALMFGSGDLSVDSGIPLLGPDGELNDAFTFPKVRTALAGAAFGRMTVDIAYMPDIRDLEEVRRRYQAIRQLGFTTGVTFYPPHVELINEIFAPSKVDVDEAEEVITAYEVALAEGNPAVTLEGGKVLLVHDYEKALKVRERAQAIVSRS